MVAVATTGFNVPTLANAQLIAAAPELLEALELAKKIFIASDLHVPHTFEVIDAAIAKARGQE
jgi:hypothetical protein